jgi:gliding motility-associated-like protein/uncharacterized repeat protein (TIGR01451 family)
VRNKKQYILIFIFQFAIGMLFAQKGKHGAHVITTPGVIYNRYSPVTVSAFAGQTFVVINNPADLEAPAISGTLNDCYSPNNLESCDLMMIIKMQGSTMSTANTAAYGNITSYNGVGDYEFFEIGSVNNTTISLANGCKLNNTYIVGGTQRVQVVRIPRLTTLTINSGGSLVSRLWGLVPGTGGVIAIETNGVVVINGSVTTQGQGFRGGTATIAPVQANATNYVSTLSNFGGEKGEGVSGTQSDYDILGGRYSRGAPANGGGGGNSDNAGGGGGSNAGTPVGYTGTGNPDNTVPAWATAWNLESASFATSISPGGGRGGYSRSSNNANALANGPGDPSWSGDNRNNIGGFGGRPLNYNSNTRLFMGGGGGAGHGDDGDNAGGANGGGIIFFISDGSISGTGTVSAQGDDAAPTFSAHQDAAGGGGGGGAITLFSKSTITGITIKANGGKGGDQLITNLEAEGPGGGGGGGYVQTTATALLPTVLGAFNGTTSSTGLTEFIPNGATKGGAGSIVNNIPYAYLTAPVNLSITITSNTPTCFGDQKTYTVTINNQACNSASNVVVNLTLPSGVSFTSSSASTGTYAAPNWSVNGVAPNSPVTLVLTGQTTSTNIGVFSGTVSSSNPECSVANNQTTTAVSTVIKVDVTAIAIPSVICLGSISTLSANGANTYTWFPGNLSGPTPTVSPTVATIYTVVGNVTVCVGSNTVQVLVNPLPTLAATAAPSLICPGDTGTLNATGAITYTWYPTFLVGATQTVIGTVPTQYTVWGTDANGCENYAIVNLPVFIPTISAFPSVICIGECSTLTAYGGVSYTWIPQNIVSPTIVVCPTVTSYYQVIGTHSSGCISGTFAGVQVWPIPTVQAWATPSRICLGESSILTASIAMQFYWLPPINVTPFNTVVVTPTVTTTYTVIGTNIHGCADTATVQVIVDPLPTVTAVADPTQICRGSTSTLTAFGAVSYTWYPPPGGAISQSIVVSPSVTTNYTVVGTNTFGCRNYTYVTVIVGPDITAIALPSVVCAGNSSSLIAGGAVTYTWHPGNQNGNVIVVTPTASGFYTVVATDNIGCKDSAAIFLQINPNPTIVATINPSVCCVGDNFTLTATGGTAYAWSPGALSGNTVSLFATSTTVYTVNSTNVFGCPGSATVLLTVNNCSVNVPIGIAKKARVMKNDNYIDYYVELTFVVKNHATYPMYNVQANDNLANTFPPPSTFTVVPPPVSISSIVTVDPAYDGQGNSNLLVANTSSLLPGQADTIKVIVKFTPNGLLSYTNIAVATAGNLPSGGFVGTDTSTDGDNSDPNGNGTPEENDPTVFHVEFDFFIPQGFSPNDDGVNDVFEIRGISFFPDNDLTVINRWGNVVYKKKHYLNTWDGTTDIGIEIGGNKLPEGTYYYILNLNNNTKPYTGFVYLNRGLTK